VLCLKNRDSVLAALSYWLFPGDQAGRGPSDEAAKRERERDRDREIECCSHQKDVMKGAAVPRERPQGSFSTQRNTKDRVNVNVFAKGGLSTTELYIPGPRYVDGQVFREYRNNR
jgi:hypothetical protein